MKVGDLVRYKIDPEAGVFIISSVEDGWCQLLEEDVDTYTTVKVLELVSAS